MRIYLKLVHVFKVHHPLVTTTIGLLAGTLVFLAYYFAPYIKDRNDFILREKEKYNLEQEVASEYYDSILMKETGSGGFIGFMLYRAHKGYHYSSYTMVNGAVIGGFDFTLGLPWIYYYWILEYSIYALFLALMGYYAGNNPFNENVNEWYGQYEKQMGATALANKEKIIEYFNKENIEKINEIMLPEGTLNHPLIEIYEQQCKNKNAEILLTIKQTREFHQQVEGRKMLGRWEISRKYYEIIKSEIEKKIKNQVQP
jgi:hypothetical protein